MWCVNKLKQDVRVFPFPNPIGTPLLVLLHAWFCLSLVLAAGFEKDPLPKGST